MSADIHDNARAIVDMMAANGAVFAYKAAASALPASFHYSLPKGGDRRKCRAYIAQAKADPALWTSLVKEIGRRCGGDPS